MATKQTKSERLELCCTKGQRRLINQAVELHGGSLTDFPPDKSRLFPRYPELPAILPGRLAVAVLEGSC